MKKSLFIIVFLRHIVLAKSTPNRFNSKILLVSIVFFLSTQVVLGQDWTVFNIGGFGKISIPPTLELRDKDSFVEKFSNISRGIREKTYNIKIAPARLVFQPSGMNQDITSKNYSRVLIYIKEGKLNEFPSLTDLFKMSENEKKQYEKNFRVQCKSVANKVGASILKIFPSEIININGASAFKSSYIRRIGTNPAIYVEIYKIFNSKMEIEITLSYRVDETEIWAKDFSSIMEQLYIQKCQ